MSPDKLVRMINQISQFYARQPEAEAAASIGDHLTRYWDPRMRAAIIAWARADGRDLAPAARRAVEGLAAVKTP